MLWNKTLTCKVWALYVGCILRNPMLTLFRLCLLLTALILGLHKIHPTYKAQTLHVKVLFHNKTVPFYKIFLLMLSLFRLYLLLTALILTLRKMQMTYKAQTLHVKVLYHNKTVLFYEKFSLMSSLFLLYLLF